MLRVCTEEGQRLGAYLQLGCEQRTQRRVLLRIVPRTREQPRQELRRPLRRVRVHAGVHAFEMYRALRRPPPLRLPLVARVLLERPMPRIVQQPRRAVCRSAPLIMLNGRLNVAPAATRHVPAAMCAIGPCACPPPCSSTYLCAAHAVAVRMQRVARLSEEELRPPDEALQVRRRWQRAVGTALAEHLREVQRPPYVGHGRRCGKRAHVGHHRREHLIRLKREGGRSPAA